MTRCSISAAICSACAPRARRAASTCAATVGALRGELARDRSARRGDLAIRFLDRGVARRLRFLRHLHAAFVHGCFVAHAIGMRGGDHRLCRVLRLYGAPIALRQHTLHRLEGEPAQAEVHGEKDRNLNEDREIRCEIHNCCPTNRAAQAFPCRRPIISTP